MADCLHSVGPPHLPEPAARPVIPELAGAFARSAPSSASLLGREVALPQRPTGQAFVYPHGLTERGLCCGSRSALHAAAEGKQRQAYQQGPEETDHDLDRAAALGEGFSGRRAQE